MPRTATWLRMKFWLQRSIRQTPHVPAHCHIHSCYHYRNNIIICIKCCVHIRLITAWNESSTSLAIVVSVSTCCWPNSEASTKCNDQSPGDCIRPWLYYNYTTRGMQDTVGWACMSECATCAVCWYLMSNDRREAMIGWSRWIGLEV